ncbi:MAG: hypothetical protein E1N59_117 [Puniceicoccaceae bacterium 5H]|nr:MAG: hypothetical protein E1N59_117 [Puniceicoccaceae bacterium 5H]
MDMINAISPMTTDAGQMRAQLAQAGASQGAGEVEMAADQFEAIFARQFLEEAMKPMFEGAISESGTGPDLYRYLLADSLSQSMAQRGVFGLGNVLQHQLQPATGSEPAENSTAQ